MILEEYKKSDHFLGATDLITMCENLNFDYLPYVEKVLAIGDQCAIRKSKGKLFRRNYERAMLLLAVASKHKSQRVLEFGTGRGFVSACLSLLPHVEHIFTIDKLDQLQARDCVSSTKKVGVDQSKIRFASKNTFKLKSGDIEGKFDLVFIDGEHTAKAVANDFKIALKQTTKDAVIVFDDFRRKHKGVRKHIISLPFSKILVYTDGWIYDNILIESHGDADKVVNKKEFGSGQVILYKNVV